MKTLCDIQQIRAILTEADVSLILESGHQAIAVEVADRCGFEGTLLYVPGIRFEDLKVARR